MKNGRSSSAQPSSSTHNAESYHPTRPSRSSPPHLSAASIWWRARGSKVTQPRPLPVRHLALILSEEVAEVVEVGGRDVEDVLDAHLVGEEREEVDT